jgi:hypothetical protein
VFRRLSRAVPFAARRAERGTSGGGGVALRPTRDLVQDLLDGFGLVHILDKDGDITVAWETCTIYFLFYGEQRDVLQARMYLARRFSVETRPTLTMLLDDWNRTKLAPKAYTVLPDDGLVGVGAEQCFDFEMGMSREALTYTVATWIDSLLRFAEWVDEQV